MLCSTITGRDCCTLQQDSLCDMHQHTAARPQCQRLTIRWPRLQQHSPLFMSVSSLTPDRPGGCSQALLGLAHQKGCSIACRESRNPNKILTAGSAFLVILCCRSLACCRGGAACCLLSNPAIHGLLVWPPSPCKAIPCSVQAGASISRQGWQAALRRQCCNAETL